jgi:hypothetical protein
VNDWKVSFAFWILLAPNEDEHQRQNDWKK